MGDLTPKDQADQADLAAMHAEPAVHPSKVLKEAPAGTRVADSTGDLWTKQWDQMWLYRNGSDTVSMTTDALLHVWGPVNVIPASGL